MWRSLHFLHTLCSTLTQTKPCTPQIYTDSTMFLMTAMAEWLDKTLARHFPTLFTLF